MKHPTVLTLLFLSVAAGFTHLAAAETTALDAYVAAPDPNYSYVHNYTRHGVGYSIHGLTMISQQWRSQADVNRVLWEHELLIAVPWISHSGNQNTAFLIVNGGSNNSEASTENEELMGVLADITGSVVAMISQVPNQPLYFADEVGPREEDALLAYGMDKYLVTGDPTWLVQLPMTKAVVRAIDTVQAFAATSDAIWPTLPRIDDVIVVGGSKRGWATWLAAAVEAQKGTASRVKAILPVSIDLANLGEQFVHHWEAYGFYAPAIQDYVDFDLPCRVNLPAGQAMLRLIDPYAYRDRLTMPKLVLNSAGDQFFLPDSSQFYFADLPGPKRLRYTLNTDHSQGKDLRSIILPTLSWLSDVLDDKQGPQFSWTLEPNGSIRVHTFTKPKRVRLWQASNPNARDFRLESIGAVWTSSDLQDTGNGVYVGYVPPPAQGWTAFTVELTFAGSTLIPTPLESDEVFTTDVRVTPADLPYAGTACVGYARDTVGVYRPSNATFYLKKTNESGFSDAVITYGIPGAEPIIGDWDGDGTDTIGVYLNGVFYLRNSNTSGFADVVVPFGIPGDVPVAGDWDGDGIDTIGVYRNGVFFLRNANISGPANLALAYGAPGDMPIAGDWTGQGFDTIGVYRPSESTFYLKDTNASGYPDAVLPFGMAGDLPVVGDWDNTGRDTVGVYRGNEFFLSVENQVQHFLLGADADVPLAGKWGL
jgi:PhoPQ-activated pathogenicity-related protein